LNPSNPLSARRLLAYAAPTVALQSMMVPLLMYLPPTYSQITGMSLALVGIMFALGRAFEAISDPLIGALSDRSRHPFGKRRIWMAIGVPIAILASWFLLQPGADDGALYLLLWLIVFYVGWTLVFIPHQSWGGELSGRYDDRTRIAGYRETGAFVGYLLAALVPLLYWQVFQGVAAPTFAQIVAAIGWFFVIALPLAVMWCFSAVPQGQASPEAHPPGWRELFAIPRRNKPFARLMTAYFIDRLAMGTYFFAQPLLIGIALDMQANLLVLSLANTVAAVMLAPLWVPITRRLGKHRTYCLANAVTILSYVVLFMAGVGEVWVVMASYILMGLGNGGTMITPPAMAADAADHDELQSGSAQMGGHMAFLAFVFKAGMACGPLMGGLALAWFGYQQTGQAVDAENLFGIRFTATWLPVLLLIPPLLLMWNYPIDARRHAQIRADLDMRRA
jgi:Na+/melibiose symporter-like transporter